MQASSIVELAIGHFVKHAKQTWEKPSAMTTYAATKDRAVQGPKAQHLPSAEEIQV